MKSTRHLEERTSRTRARLPLFCELVPSKTANIQLPIDNVNLCRWVEDLGP